MLLFKDFLRTSCTFSCGCHECISCGPVHSGLRKAVVREWGNPTIPGAVLVPFLRTVSSTMKCAIQVRFVVNMTYRMCSELISTNKHGKVEGFLDEGRKSCVFYEYMHRSHTRTSITAGFCAFKLVSMKNDTFVKETQSSEHTALLVVVVSACVFVGGGRRGAGWEEGCVCGCQRVH